MNTQRALVVSVLGTFRIALFSALALVAPTARTATITVTSPNDTISTDTLTTLREAITSINNQADINGDVTLNRVGGYGTNDTVIFDIPSSGVQTIPATSAEPTIIKPLTIDGYTQSVSSANTLANSDNAVILIQLTGVSAGANVDGLTLGPGSGGSTIRGLDIISFTGNGIVVQSNGNSVLGNFVGVDPTGTTRMPNGSFPTSGDGILILNASSNQIGSTSVADRNIASGNAITGIHIVGTLVAPATGNIVQGNFVGVAADGKSSVGTRTEPAPAPGSAEGNNLAGIEISGGNLNTIGGTVAGSRNVVGLNGLGIEVDNGGQQNIIQGNFCGVGADGITPAANLLHGIVLRSSNGFSAPLGPAQANEPGVSFNLVGGTVAGAGNLVEFNGTGGVAVFGNTVSASGAPNVGNAIEGNSVFENGRRFATASSAPTPLLGIELTNGFVFPRDDGVTPNDSKGHGAPNDPNNFQNFPVLTAASPNAGNTVVTGTLNSAPGSTFRIEFFANDADPLGLPAEGQQFLGFANTTTDASGSASFSPSFVGAVAIGRIVTATATDASGNTSEFSTGVVVKTSQTIAFGPQTPSTQTFAPSGTFSLNPTATASSGLAVSYSSLTTSVCTISATTVTIVAAGTCTIAADQAGDATYGAAAQVAQDITIGVASQTITNLIATPANPTFAPGGTFTLGATGGASGNPVTFTIAAASAGVCSAGGSNGATITMLTAGTCAVQANQAGSANYGAAAQVIQNIAIGMASQAITNFVATPANPTFGPSGTFAVAATGGASGNAVTFSIAAASASVCSASGINGATITMLGVGTCTVQANQAGSVSYAAATQALLNVVLGKTPSTIALASSADPSQLGSWVTFMVTVNAASPAGIAPPSTPAHVMAAGSVQATKAVVTGTVSFTDGATSLGTASLVNGAATFATPFTTAGNHLITASYSGDAVTAAASITIPQAVGVANPVVPAPALSHWVLLLLTGLICAVARAYRVETTLKGSGASSAAATRQGS